MTILPTRGRPRRRRVPLAPRLCLALLSTLAAACGSSDQDPGGLGGTGLRPNGGQPGMSRNGKALGVIAPVPDPLGMGGGGGGQTPPAMPPGTPPSMPPGTPPSMPPGTPPNQTTAARVKFCHNLIYRDMDIKLELVIGNQRLSAMTGSCSSATGQMCMDMPTGLQKLSLIHDGKTIATAEHTFRGVEYGIYAEVDDEGVYIAGGALRPA
jgi:hypothetical protein